MSFAFQCSTCGEWHEGMPALSAQAPTYYYSIPEDERGSRCFLDTDICVVDEEFYFLRSNLLIPVEGLETSFMWGIWVSVSKANFADYFDHYDSPERNQLGPYFGWLSSILSAYPDTENLKTLVHLQVPGTRPRIEMEPTDHPLAVEQRNGITQDRLKEIYSACLHS